MDEVEVGPSGDGRRRRRLAIQLFFCFEFRFLGQPAFLSNCRWLAGKDNLLAVDAIRKIHGRFVWRPPQTACEI